MARALIAALVSFSCVQQLRGGRLPLRQDDLAVPGMCLRQGPVLTSARSCAQRHPHSSLRLTDEPLHRVRLSRPAAAAAACVPMLLTRVSLPHSHHSRSADKPQ